MEEPGAVDFDRKQLLRLQRFTQSRRSFLHQKRLSYGLSVQYQNCKLSIAVALLSIDRPIFTFGIGRRIENDVPKLEKE